MNQSSVRHQEIERAMKYDHLASDRFAQSEAIAHHYAAHAAMAVDLLELIRYRQFGNRSPAGDDVIERLTRELQNAHRHDLGLELAWFKPDEKR